MRKILCTTLLTLGSYSAFAQTTTSGDDVMDIFTSILVLLAALAMVVHMLYDNFFRKKFRTDYTAAEFRNLRKEQGMGDMPAQEAMELDHNIDQILTLWGELPNEDGDLVPYPLKRSAVKKSIAILEQAVAAMPTNSRIVERINDAHEILNHALKRQFNGSKAMVITAVIVGIVLSAIAGSPEAAVAIGIGIALYLLASRSTNFLIAEKQQKGGGGGSSFLSGIIGGLFMGVAAAKTYKTVTTYSDGTTKTETDNSETWISLIFGLIIMVLLSLLLSVISVINYLRNYIIYW